MRNSSAKRSTLLLATLGAALLSACGAGTSEAPSLPALAPLAAAVTSAPIDPPADVLVAQHGSAAEIPLAPTDPSTAPPPPTSLSPLPGVLTNVRFESTAAAEQQRVPVTFGQPFGIGHVKSSQTLTAKLADGSTVPLQVDVKARHPDGSVRHAILSALVGKLAAGETQTMTLSTAAAPATVAAPAATTPAALLDSGFTASVNVDIGGQRYSASADTLLRSGSYQSWLSGPVVNEWMVSAPLMTAQGTAHPHLSARFAIRAVSGSKQARVDVTVENSWAFEAAPQNFTYDTQVLVGGLPVYTKAGLTHYHHARWRKVFWYGATPEVHVKHNVAYLIATRAVPNFSQAVVFSETKLASWKAGWTGAKTEPMGVGQALPAMPTTGGRDDIGLLPAWAATYLLSQDKRVKEVTLGTADLAGSWSAHYRDRNTGRPVSVIDYPYMTIYGNTTDTLNPQSKKLEAFPVCATTTACNTPYEHDGSHQPAFAYLPYLVTGDYYYLEELQFWAMWDVFMNNPGYRAYSRGLLQGTQVRGQAWSLRTVGEAAYITPDADPLKSQLAGFVDNNLDWYNTNYLNGPFSNNLGVIIHGGAILYDNGVGIAPWQDDFFTSAIGHLAELGFTKAKPFLAWKAQFPIGRMIGTDTCWITGAMYTMKVRDSTTAPVYTSIGQAWKASTTADLSSLACGSSAMAANLGLKVGEMTGYSGSNAGYPSNMQPALAYAADVGGLSGANAWGVFMARSVKPNYGDGPQFAIVPR